jgi:hypothetical protein
MANYHLELRQFPRNFTRFNLTGAEIGTIALTWAQERMLTIDDEKWSPAEATMIILEGPTIPIERLSMGRGWPTALRESEDVTERVLAEARVAMRESSAPAAPNGTSGAPSGVPAHPDVDPLALGVELGGLLGAEPSRLLAAWRAVAARSSGLAPSESLALAERELGAGSGTAD